MDIKQLRILLSGSDKNEVVSRLMNGRARPLPDIPKIKKELDPTLHEVQDPVIRKKKPVKYTVLDDNNNESIQTRYEDPTRISIPLEKLIVKRAASFLFGNKVKIETDKQDSRLKQVVEKMLAANKQIGLNKKAARTLFSCTEVAEYWYMVDAETATRYGIPNNDSKVKVALFDPLKGDELYPYFDDYGDLIAFTRSYKKKNDDGVEASYMQTWTAERIIKFKRGASGWEEESNVENVLKKIPIVYGSQDQVEWADSIWARVRLEKLLSNFGDTNDYHHAPKWVVKGEVKGWSSKGEPGAILEIENEGDASLVAWNQAPESVKLEIDKLFQIAYAMTQTPDISFDAVKGLGSAASGNSLRMLFLDPHLKVEEHLEEFDPYLERRLSILKAFAVVMDDTLKDEVESTELTPVVTPYMVDDTETTLNNINLAKSTSILSRNTAVRLNPLVSNAEEEIEMLDKEKEEADASAAALNNAQNQDPFGGGE
ncbi:MAG: phage portal protein [Chitinophagaceae bacterium]|nr:phage portal protein [Chitinophagaceae bacterium]